VFFRDRVIVQSFRISTLFTVYISLLVLGTSFTISCIRKTGGGIQNLVSLKVILGLGVLRT
jgi:hypothetical protein